MFDGCVETQKGPKTARPGQLHPIREFNDLIGIDGFYWKGKRDFQVHVIHCIDEGSLFHLGKRNDRGANLTQGLLEDMWFSWAKAPSSLYSDPAGEFISERWLDFLQEHNIKPELTSEAWHRGRVERHGGVIKDMLTRMDAEQPFENTADFDMALRKCFQSKNSMIKHNGFSPEQIVLGKATKLPASLTCDEDLAAHSLAGSDTPEAGFSRASTAENRPDELFFRPITMRQLVELLLADLGHTGETGKVASGVCTGAEDPMGVEWE